MKKYKKKENKKEKEKKKKNVKKNEKSEGRENGRKRKTESFPTVTSMSTLLDSGVSLTGERP